MVGRYLAAFVVCVILAGPGAISSAVATEKTQQAIDAAAKQIVEQILRSASVVDQIKGYVYGARPRVAIWPFDEENVPIAKDAADELIAIFTASFLNHAAGRIDVIGRTVIRDLMDDMRATGRLRSAHDNPSDALLKNAQKIDILIKGIVKPDGRDISLRFKAARIDAAVVAQTHPVLINLRARDQDPNRRPTSVDQAITAAAKDFANFLPDMKTLILGGLHYEDTGVQPPFARYLVGKVEGHFTRAYAGVLTGKKLAVRKIRRNVGAMRGVGAEARELKNEAVATKQGEYVLSGTYWEFEDSLEVQLNLRNNEGKSHAWSGRVRLDSIGNIAFRPNRANQGPASFDRLRENDGGGFGFTLTTGAGEDPVLKLGDLLDLVIHVDRDAWVYCFIFQADGTTVQLFPNPFFWESFNSPRLAGSIQHTIPGDDTFPFQLKVQPPVGEELLKCFAASRDVTQDLPAELRGRSLEPLEGGMDARLSHIFSRLRDATVSEASVALTVVE